MENKQQKLTSFLWVSLSMQIVLETDLLQGTCFSIQGGYQFWQVYWKEQKPCFNKVNFLIHLLGRKREGDAKTMNHLELCSA